MQHMPLNVTMPQKSTERYKLVLPESTVAMIEVCATLLQERRMVAHTNCDALVVAMESVTKIIPTQVRMLCRFYCSTQEAKRPVKLRKEVKDAIYQLSKKYKATAAAFVDAVITIFLKATLASLWKNKQHYYSDIRKRYPDFVIRKRQAPLNVNETKQLTVKRRKLKLKKDEIEMRHHNYMEEFRSYMEKFGGIDKWLNQNVLLMIHARPLANTVGKSTELDLPKEQNSGAVHMVRLWKRGRGYNLTIIANHKSEYGEEPPHLEPGSVYRLYDIYRNIDWLTITSN